MSLSLIVAISIISMLTLWLVILTWIFVRTQKRFRALTTGVAKEDLGVILQKLHEANQLTRKEIIEIQNRITQVESSANMHFQHMGFLRYNPFSDTGGDQSFCISLLDGQQNGVVISSLHSRDQTRIYAKQIIAGQSQGHTLSKEERAVIQTALNQ